MKRKGISLLEVVLAMGILTLLTFMIVMFMSSKKSELSNLDQTNDKFINANNILNRAIFLDNDKSDGVLTGITDTELIDNINVKAATAKVNGKDVNYELYVTDVNSQRENSQALGYNFDSIEYTDRTELVGDSIKFDILYNGSTVSYTPNYEVFPKNSYFIKNEPYGNPLDGQDKQGLYFRMDTDKVPDIGESHKNYLLDKGNSITVETYPHISTPNRKYITYFPESKVESLLTELSTKDPTNKWQVVYFKAPAVTYGDLNYSIASVIMDESNKIDSPQHRFYDFDLKRHFPSNDETHLIFIADGQFDWSYFNYQLNKTASNSDDYTFRVNGGHVYFLSLSGKHISGLNTSADITNKFAVRRNPDNTRGQITIANTKPIVGTNARYNDHHHEHYNARTSRMEFLDNSDMLNAFFYLPFQDVTFNSVLNHTLAWQTPLNAQGGIVARNVYFSQRFRNITFNTMPNGFGNRHKYSFVQWNGDPKILGYGIDDY